MKDMKWPYMAVLAGEQSAPNLLPARHFKPQQILIFHTDFWKSKMMAERLSMRLQGMNPQLHPVAAYDPGEVTRQIIDVLPDDSGVLINITGGTKPMSLGGLVAAYQTGNPALYIRSQGGVTNMDFYGFTDAGTPYVRETITIGGTITLEDYLVSYFGSEYQFTGFGVGAGVDFERVVYETLKPEVDEIEAGWKHESGAVDVDTVIRCNNQVGIIEVKTGKKAVSTDGIKQLAVAGGQRFFGTYTKRFLIMDREWSEPSNNRALAEAIGIISVELPGYSETGELHETEVDKLISIVHENLGKPTRE